jgi:hypothetical protein
MQAIGNDGTPDKRINASQAMQAKQCKLSNAS